MTAFDSSLLPNLLPFYYKRIFPYKAVVKWLSYGQKPSAYFSLREFAFILKDDVHTRYRSFSDQSEFEKEMRKNCPEKLDIGAPKDHKKVRDFDAIERELVFDIDLTDYDDVRTCCSGVSMCKKCWRFMTIAVTVMESLLKKDFGFSHCLWVYSGRRGIHCWVADKIARKLDVPARKAVADYLSGSKDCSKKVRLQPNRKTNCIHPMLQSAYELIVKSTQMKHLVVEQKWLDDKEQWSKVLGLCSDEQFRSALEKDMTRLKSVEERWQALMLIFESGARGGLEENKRVQLPDSARMFLMEFVLHYAYPRLDIHVTTGLNHLLKCPFCVHPKTGKIAVPFDARLVEKFEIDSVPRIDRLVFELSNIKGNENDDTRKALDYKRTSLAPFIETFEMFIRNIAKDLPADSTETDQMSVDF